MAKPQTKETAAKAGSEIAGPFGSKKRSRFTSAPGKRPWPSERSEQSGNAELEAIARRQGGPEGRLVWSSLVKTEGGKGK